MPENNKLTLRGFFIYARKSNEAEDRQALSLPAQIRELSENAKEENIKIIDIYSESKSAFTPNNRPHFEHMMERLLKGEADGILTWQGNRLARNSLDGGKIIHYMDIGKISEIRTPQRSYNNTPNDKFMLSLDFSIAKKDSDEKSVNVKRGNRQKYFEKKIWIGKAKQGYLNTIDPYTKQKEIEVDLERFAVIQKGIILILSGTYTPMQALAKLNNEWGYRTLKTPRQGGKPMGKSSWYKLLSDTYYYGLMDRSEGIQQGSHVPMITKEEFERLQIILGRKGRPHNTKHEFAFKEILKCGECNGSITCEAKWQIICSKCKTKFHKGKKTTACRKCDLLIEEMENPKILNYIFYHCTKRVHTKCTQGSIRLDRLEEQVDNELKRYEIPEEFRDWAIKYLNEESNRETTERTQIESNIQKALTDTKKRIDSLLSLKISPQNIDGSVISEEEYISQRKILLEEKESLMRQLKAADERQDKWLELSERTFNFARYARYWFSHGDLKTKTEILSTLGSNLTIFDKMLRIDGQKSLFIIEKGKKEAEAIAQKLEPTKKIDLTGQMPSLEPVRMSWLAILDYVRTSYQANYNNL